MFCLMIITCRSYTVFCKSDCKKVGGWQVSPIYLTIESITVNILLLIFNLHVILGLHGYCIGWIIKSWSPKKVGHTHFFQDGGKYWYFLGITGTSQNHSTTIHAVYLILGLNQTCWNVDNYKAHLVCYDILSYCFWFY